MNKTTSNNSEKGLVIKKPVSFLDRLTALGKLTARQGKEIRDRAFDDQDNVVRLIRMRKLLPEDQLISELALDSGIEVADPKWLQDAKALKGINYTFLKQNKILPLGKANGVLKVACANPYDYGALTALEQVVKAPYKPYIQSEDRILGQIEVIYGLGTGEMSHLGPEADDFSRDFEEETNGGIDSDAPAVRMLNFLLDRAVAVGASDIHVEPQENQLRVRFRVDGILHDQERFPRNMHSKFVSLVKIRAKLNIAERRLPQDGQIQYSISGKDLDLRVSTLPTSFGESIVVRLLYRETLAQDLSGLGVDESQFETLLDLIERPYGLVLVTGPTGSGKTTTLYAALRRINSPDKKIITIEDPIEYHLQGVNQIQVNNQVGLTFASGLRSIVRQDPDVILVGEIRDRETADIAIHAALTGHLVFSTLHTKDAAGAITRLQDMGVDSFLISSALSGVLAQRLVRNICPHCKNATTLNRKVLDRLGIAGAGQEMKVYRPKGCQNCASTGYQGRTGIFELMEITEEIRELINLRRDSETVKHKAVSQGMTLLMKDGFRKMRQGVTSLEEVLRVTTS